MRLFSHKENELLKKLVEYKNDTNLQDLQVARLLRKELSFLAIKWEIEPKMNVDLYCVVTDDKKDPLKQLFSVINFIYFVNELERIGYIRLLNISSERKEKLRILYDKEKYIFNEEKNQFINKNIDTENDSILSLVGDCGYQLFGKIDNYEYVSQLAKQQFPNSFAKDLDDIVYSIIYPMPVLEDYVNNGFKTLEDKRYDSNFKIANKSLRISYCTLGVSILAFCVSIISIFSGRPQIEAPTDISSEQISALDSIGFSNSDSLPSKIVTPIEIVIQDTIKVLPINK